MSAIDNRIVDMHFNNKQFESGISSSAKALDKFDKDLNKFTTSDFSNAFTPMSNAIQHIGERFSWVGEIAQQFRERVVGMMMDLGAQMADKAALFTPWEGAGDGFNEYELKMGAIQTIMAGTGESLDTVNKYLDELNTYADQTIYSFKDMTSNIGKFTNAGVKLKDAVGAIQGTANLAAVSGATAEQASHAMYNLAQALSSGFVKLIDWKSIENANMATVEFKEYLLETAVAAGKVEKRADGMYRTLTTNAKGETSDWFNATVGFNDALNHQWMTTEVLTKTLGDYADTTTLIGEKASKAATEVKTYSMMMDALKEGLGSGWGQTFELIIGNFSEAKEMWTNVSIALNKIVDSSAQARNALVKDWKEAGGRLALIEIIANSFKGLVSVLGTIKGAFREVFPAWTAKQWVDLTKSIAVFSNKLLPTEKVLSQITRVFKGLFSVISIVLQPVKFAYEAFKRFLGLFDFKIQGESFISTLLEMAAKMGDFVVNMDKALKGSEMFGTALRGIEIFVEKVKVKIGQLVEFLRTSPIVQGLIDGIKNGVKMVSDTISKMVKTIVTTFKNLLGIHSPSKVFFDMGTNLVQGLVQGLQDGVSLIAGAIYGMVKGIKEMFVIAFAKTGSALGALGGWLTSGFTGSLEYVTDAMTSFSSKIKGIDFSGLDTIKEKFRSLVAESTIIASIVTMFNRFIEAMKKVWGWIKTTFGPIIDFIIEKFKELSFKDVIGGGVLITVAMTIMKFIKTLSTVFESFGSVMDLFNNVSDSFTGIFDKLGDSLVAFQASIKAEALRVVAWSIALLTGALVVMAYIPWDPLQRGLTGMAGVVGGLVVAMQGMRGATFGGTGKIIATGLALLFLAMGLKSISQAGDISPALGALTLLMALLVAFNRLAGGDEVRLGALQLVALGIAMRLIAGGVAVMAAAPWEGLLAGSVAFGIVLAAIWAFVKYTDAINFMAIAGSMISMSGGIYILLKAIKAFADVSGDVLMHGISAIGLSIIVLGASLRLFPAGGAPKLIAFAIGLSLLLIPIKLFAKYAQDQSFWTGIRATAVALGALGLASLLFPSSGPPKLMGLALALILLLIPIKVLGNMNLWALVKGIVALAFTFKILAAGVLALSFVGKVFGNVIPNLIGLAVALTILTIPIALMGSMDLWTLIKGIIGIGAAMIILAAGVLAMNLAGSGKEMLKVAGGLILLAVALTILTVPIALMGLLPFGVMIQGIIAIAIMLGVLTAALKYMPDSKKMGGIAYGLIRIAGALAVLGVIITALGFVNPGILATGLIALGLALAIVVIAVNKMPKDVAKQAKNLILLNVALLMLAGGIAAIGLLGFDAIGSGLIGLLGTLLLAAFAVEAFPDKAKCFGVALGIGALSVALILLTVPLAILGSMNLAQLGIGFLILTVALGSLVLAAELLGAAAIPVGAFGVALILFAGGAYILVAALELLVKTIVYVVEKVGDFFGWLFGSSKKAEASGGLADSVDKETAAMKAAAEKNINPKDYKAMGKESMQELGEGYKQGGADAAKAAGEVTKTLDEQVSDSKQLKVYRSKGRGITTAVANGLTDGMPDISKAAGGFDINSLLKGGMDPSKAMEMVQGYMGADGIAGGLDLGNMDLMNHIQANGIGDVSGILGDNVKIPEIKDLYQNAMGENGAAGGVKTGGEEVVANIKQLGTDVTGTMDEELKPEKMFNSITNYFSGAETAVNEAKTNLPPKVSEVGTAVVSAAETSMSQEKFEPVGENIVDGVVTGIDKNENKLISKVQQMANNAVKAARKALDSHSPSKVFAEIGKDVDAGLALGITNGIKPVISSVENVGGDAAETMRKTLSGLDMSNMDMDANPTITPVLDLSNVQRDAKQIPGMLNGATGRTRVEANKAAPAVDHIQQSSRGVPIQTTPASNANTTVQSGSLSVSNTFNVKNENDARQISNKLGQYISREYFLKGAAVS